MRTLLAVICGVAIGAGLFTPARGAAVDWVGTASARGPGFAAVGPFTIFPSSPDHDDVVQFYEEFNTPFSWTCDWELPTPRLSVHTEAKLVEVTMDWPPPPRDEGCAMLEAGQMFGLLGEFGPLKPGLWEYRSELFSAVYSFTVVPEPAGVVLLALVPLLVRRRRRERPVP